MYTCIYIFIYTCIYIYIYMFIYTHMCIHIHICIFIYVYTYTSTYLYIEYFQIFVHVYICIYIYVHIYAYSHTRTQTHTHTHTQTHTRTHTHTHTQTAKIEELAQSMFRKEAALGKLEHGNRKLQAKILQKSARCYIYLMKQLHSWFLRNCTRRRQKRPRWTCEKHSTVCSPTNSLHEMTSEKLYRVAAEKSSLHFFCIQWL